MSEVKRVLHVVSAMDRCGAETMLMNIYRNIDRNKIQFDFICHKEKKFDYEDEILELGGKIIRVKSLGKSGFVKYVENLRKVIEDNGPYHAVHGHTDIQTGAVALAARLAGIKIRISHSHSTAIQSKESLKIKIYYMVLKKIILLFSTDYCACSMNAGEFLFGKRNRNKVNIINNGIQLEKFINVDKNKSDILRKSISTGFKNEILIGHVGRFIDVKNHKFLIELAKMLNEKKVNYKIVLVGEGPLYDDILTKISTEGLNERFKILGVRSDIDIILSAIDIFILPSKYEGIPLVLIEAQATGKNCVISDTVDINCDLGLNLVHRLSLNSGYDHWSNKILEIYNDSKLVQSDFICKTIKKSGYDVHDNINKVYKLYGIKI